MKTIVITCILIIYQQMLFAQDTVTVPSSTTPSALKQTLSEIQKKEKNGHYALALNELLGIHKLLPDDDRTRLILGRLYVKTGHPDKALPLLRSISLQTTDDWRPWFWAGTALLQKQDLNASQEYLDEALDREGKVAAIWIQRAILEQEKGNNQAALNLLQVANGISPDNADIMLNYAYTHERAGNLKEAVSAYRRFLQLSATLSRYGRIRSEILQRLSAFQLKQTAAKVADQPFKNN